MDKNKARKILVAAFCLSIGLFLFVELKSNLQNIKHELDDSAPAENSGEEAYKNRFHTESPTNKTETDNRLWKAVERRDSYNNELQYYSRNNADIREGSVIITTKKETIGNKAYSSGLVESTSAYKYGYFEFTIQVYEGKGLFPAIWLLPVSGESLPEIDIFEMIGSEPNVFYGVIHFEENEIKDSDYFAHTVPEKELYTVALDWKAEILAWYIDGKQAFTTNRGVPQEYMYIIINQAVGGDWPGHPDENTVFPCRFVIHEINIEHQFLKGRNYE
jgi:beta-glucanase (GH16 family)